MLSELQEKFGSPEGGLRELEARPQEHLSGEIRGVWFCLGPLPEVAECEG
jgi:hypothetical protein